MSPAKIPQSSEASLWKGAWSVFRHNGHEIAFRWHAIWQRQTLYVDGEEIFSGRLGRTEYVHTFTIAGEPCSIRTHRAKREEEDEVEFLRCDFLTGDTLIESTWLSTSPRALTFAIIFGVPLGMMIVSDLFEWYPSSWVVNGFFVAVLLTNWLLPNLSSHLHIEHGDPDQAG